MVIGLTGLIGNTTTIIVFSQRRLRSLRSSFFLTCLAMTDLLFIFILVIVLLDELHLPVMTKPMCLLTIYLSHIASFLSSNFTLAYTTHRLIAVFFPIKVTTFLKQRTNRILALTLLAFACLFYSLSFSVTTTKFRTNSTNIVYCEEDPDKSLLFPFLVLDTLFTFIVPCTSILCMNLAIVYKLQTTLIDHNQLSTSNSTTRISASSIKLSNNSMGLSMTETFSTSQLNTSNSKNTNNNNLSDSNNLLRQSNRSLFCLRPIQRYKQINSYPTASLSTHRESSSYQTNPPFYIRSTQCRATASAKTTKMLLAASTVFLVFNLPYHLLLICFLFIKQQPLWMFDAVNMARLWFFASFCVNFFVYAIWGQRFRNEVVRLFSCSFIRCCIEAHKRKQFRERNNSIYLSHRLLPLSSTRIFQTS